MPIIGEQNFQTGLRESRLPLLGEPVLTPATLEQLKIPDEIALKPENVIPFLASQSVRYHEIVDRSEIKTLEGDIPEYLHDDSPAAQQASSYPGISREEQAALASYSQERLVQIQSPGDVDRLNQEIDDFIDGWKSAHPEQAREMEREVGSDGAFDPFSDYMGMQIAEETDEQKEKWLTLLAAASDPETFNTIMGMRYADRVKKRMGQLVNQYAGKTNLRDEAMKDMNLERNPSPADLTKAQWQMGKYQGELSTLMMMIQQAVSDLEKITVHTSSQNTSIRRPLEVMINNVRT